MNDMNNNLIINHDESGKMVVNDEALNEIIRQNELAGISMKNAVSAITFEDDPDEKTYLLLLSYYDCVNDEYDRNWEIYIGRQSTYNYLKALVQNEDIDPNKSFVCSAEVDNSGDRNNVKSFSIPITVFRFLKTLLETNKVLDDGVGFDINTYELYERDSTILEV